VPGSKIIRHRPQGTPTAPPGPTLHTLTVTPAGTGSGTSTGAGDYEEGQVATVTQNPNPGSEFAGFSGDGTGTVTRSVTMSADKTVTITWNTLGGGFGSSVVPGTGAVLKEDLVSTESPTAASLWQSYISPESDGGGQAWTSADDSVQRLSASPDPHIAIDRGTASTFYRRIKTLGSQLNGAVSGTPATVTVDDCSEWPTACRGAGQGEGLVSINGARSFTYTSRSGTVLSGCGNWSGTPTSQPDNAKVQVQGPFDAAVPNSATRTQLLKHSTQAGQVFYHLLNGNDYIWYVSVKCQNPTPLVGISAATGRSMIVQYKEYPNPGSENPIFAIDERENDLRVMIMGTELASPTFDQSVGWIRFAFAFRMATTTAGRLRVFADLDGSGDMEQITATFNVRTLVNATGKGIPSVGPYHNLGVGPITRDYANIQICEYTGF
jgi:hypothetical protein